MNHRWIRCTVATFVFVLFWSLGGVVPGIHADQRQEIARLAEVMHWRAGTIVADVGAGDGTYSFEAAEKVGPSGRVYATEIDKEKLKILRAEVAKRKLYNVIIVDSGADDTSFRRAAAMRFFCDTYITTLRSRKTLIEISCAR